MPKLTPSQQQKVKQVLNGSIPKILKTPIERHQLLLHWNFDDGIKPWQYFVDQSDTDLGTIVLLYWLLSPGSAYQHTPNDEESRQVLALLKKIETNVKSHFYTNQNISVNPTQTDSGNFLDESDNKAILDKIPSDLTQKSPGEPVVYEELNKEFVHKVYPLTVSDRESLASCIDKGLVVLQELEMSLTKDSDPLLIIDVLDQFTKSKRPLKEQEAKFSHKEKSCFSDLDLVFGAQLVRTANWQWFVDELHEQVLDHREFVLISKDKRYKWHPKEMSEYYARRRYAQSITISELFEVYKDLDGYKTTAINKNLDNFRQERPDLSQLSYKQLQEQVVKDIIDQRRKAPYYETRWANLTYEQIYTKDRSEIDMWWLVYRLYPNYISNFEDFAKTEHFTDYD